MDQVGLIAEFETDLQTRGLSDDTIEQYPGYIRTLYAFVDGDLLGVTEEVLVAYLAHLLASGLSPASIKRYFAVIGTFYRFLVFKKYITVSPVTPVFYEYYLKGGKKHSATQRRQCITIDQAKTLVHSILDPKELAVVVLMLKTGMRVHEVVELNVESVDMKTLTINIAPTGKRSNEVVYFDKETAYVLQKWLSRRGKANKNKLPALFLDRYGNRLSSEAIYNLVIKHGTAVGLHNPKSKRLQDRLSPHSFRHFFTTRLIEGKCPREFVKELRGDSNHDTVDIYTLIDKKKLQQAYLDSTPQLDLI